QGLHPFAAAAFLAAVEELFAGLWRFVLRQPGRQELLAEAFQVFERQTLRAKALFVCLLGVVQGIRTIHQSNEEVLLLLEAIVAQADGVLDDVISSPLILLRRDLQVLAHEETDFFSP